MEGQGYVAFCLNQWGSPQAEKFIFDPLFFQTEGEEHAALGKKPMELAAAGENNYLKRCM